MRKVNKIIKPLVYVECDYEDSEKCRDFVIEHGGIPIITNLLFDNQDSHFNYVMLGKCDELWCFDKEYPSVERDIAKKRLMPIRYFDVKEIC